MIPFDLPPRPALWTPPKPAIICAASLKDINVVRRFAMPLFTTFGAASALALRSKSAGFALTGNSLGTYTSSGSDLGTASASAYRQQFAAALFSVNSTAVRLTFIARSGAAMTINKAFIGPKAASGDAWDMASQTALLFSGAASSGSFSAGTTKTTDLTAYTLDKTKDQIIAWETSAGSISYHSGSTANITLHYKDGGSDAATLDVAGYTTYSANTPNSITLFEY